MAFAVNFKTYEKNSTYKKNEFLDLELGRNTIRVLTENPTVAYVHYLPAQKLMVKCLGDDICPICKTNRVMWLKYNKDARNQQGYISRTQQAYANVLDKTLVKICPNEECHAEVKAGNIQGKFPVNCPKCSAVLASVTAQPLNRVKIFSFGKELSEQISVAEVSTVDSEGTPYGVMNMDLDVIVMISSGKKTKMVQSGKETGPLPYEVSEDQFFDLSKAVQEFSPDELNELVRGVPARDIWAARNATNNAPAEEKSAPSVDIDKLFM